MLSTPLPSPKCPPNAYSLLTTLLPSYPQGGFNVPPPSQGTYLLLLITVAYTLCICACRWNDHSLVRGSNNPEHQNPEALGGAQEKCTSS